MALAAWSFQANIYSTSSVLSSGKWVKIEIPEDGVYEISSDELAQMGFNDINNVALYGYGGHMLNEVLTGTHTDDLKQMPMLQVGNKLCFYAKGALETTLNNPASAMPYFDRTLNTYSRNGYYFLTENNGESPSRIRNFKWVNNEKATCHATSLNWFLHEQELNSISRSGKDLLGERLFDVPAEVDYNLPNLASTNLTVLTRVAAVITSASNQIGASASASVIAGGQNLPLDYSTTLIPRLKPNSLERYHIKGPVASVTLPSILPSGKVRVNNVVPSPDGADATISNSYLDYVIITYEQHNALSADNYNQLEMFYPTIEVGDTILLRNASSTAMVWNLDGPVPVSLQRLNNSSNEAMFTSPTIGRGAHFVAFDPNKKLRHITAFESIGNQNLHALTTPDYLIFTRKEFVDAAEQLAQLHRSHDGMDVLVVTQDQVFNEFSSGTPDAMALRLFCKMLYDRNPNKFKYLLMFGQGTFDNRQLISNKERTLVTFETDNSDDEAQSYSSDDFYGILGDGTGSKISSERICLGVGRLTPENVEEAEAAVLKVSKYVTEPNYGPWRNNSFIAADEGNNDLHISQAQAIIYTMENTNGILLNQYKDYVPFFPKAVDEVMAAESNRSAPSTTQYMADALSRGMYFASYVGHAYHGGFTSKAKMWLSSDVTKTAYTHLPIMTTACCDVARFDSNVRGIAEHMINKVDGGAIALLTASRTVYANDNHALNNAFTNAFFTRNANGVMPTLGEVTMKAKQSFTSANNNKMMFLLLGDPAIRINYPLPLIKTTKLNGTAIEDSITVAIAPMQYLDIEAQVMSDDGETPDNSFTGDATVTLFDAERFYKSVKLQQMYYDINYPRQQLAQVDAKVVNGKLTARLLVPRDLGITTGNMRLSLYAHKTGTSQMVNGRFDNLTVNTANTSTPVTDNQAPVITAMYFDDEATFADNKTTTPDGILHISATDETALNMGSGTSGSMKLVLDNGSESLFLIKNCGTLSNGGKYLDVVMPMSGMQAGNHTLTFTLQDVAGNVATKFIDFKVAETPSVELAVAELPATNQATFNVAKNALPVLPELTIKVTDATGKIVWQKTASQFPCTWNLTGLDGKRVPNGVYRFWGTYDDESYYGGTSKRDLIVVEPAN